MYSATAVEPSLKLLAQTVNGITIAELTGELDLASAPAVREQLLSLLRPGSNRLVTDLSKVSFADASGLAVLVSTARRARLLGGFLHLAAVSPPVAQVLHITGLHRNFAIFRTVQDAAMGQRGGRGSTRGARAAGAQARPASGDATPPPVAANASELREAVATLLTGAEAWHNADSRRRFTPALGAMARACNGTDDTALYTAARSLLSALARHPITYSPAVVATATRLRQVLNPAPGSVPRLRS
jgi:anti-anti-sigma factor